MSETTSISWRYDVSGHGVSDWKVQAALRTIHLVNMAGDLWHVRVPHRGEKIDAIHEGHTLPLVVVPTAIMVILRCTELIEWHVWPEQLRNVSRCNHSSALKRVNRPKPMRDTDRADSRSAATKERVS